MAAFFAAHERKAWKPGEVDCCLFLASWALWLGHRDPAQHLRGTYSTEAGFKTIVEAAGGVVSVVSECTDSIGGRLLLAPEPGAIGVIGSPSVYSRQFGAIFDGSRWRVRFVNCIGSMAAAPLAIWKI